MAGQTVANLVIARIGAGGKVTIYNNLGSTVVVADVQGWFTRLDASEEIRQRAAGPAAGLRAAAASGPGPAAVWSPP